MALPVLRRTDAPAHHASWSRRRASTPPRGSGLTPDHRLLDRGLQWIRPFERLVRPVFLHEARIPGERPLLFVGNHTLGGVLDAPFLFAHLYRSRGMVLRPLAHRLHFQVPVWRELIERVGIVEGTRDNCAELMAGGAAILVFPGGAREVSKRKGEAYQLLWGDRIGFARMALRHGCTLVPFAALGVEDALDIVLDADDMMRSPAGEWLQNLGVPPELMIPVVRGIGRTPIPRPERLYFWFGEPIPTAALQDRAEDDDACLEVREQVRAAILAGLEEARDLRERDPDRHVLARLLTALSGEDDPA